jgi:hypothetical protein
MRTLLNLAAGALIALAAAANAPVWAQEAALSTERYMKDVNFLASDEMQGRGSGSPELERAAEYIAAEFAAAGLTPAGENGTFFQSFEVTTGAVAGDNNQFGLGETAFRQGEDFVPILFSSTAEIEAPLVFAGYGISAPELDYDDYADIDATGKIAVVLRHEPQEDDTESKFQGANFTRHASFVNKAINARLHGAVGVIFLTDPVHEDQEIGPATRQSEQGDMNIPALHARRETLEGLFEAMGQDLGAIQEAIDEDLTPRSFDFAHATATITTDIVRTRKTVRNVIGALEGSDPVLRDEWVVVGAHYDHLGLGDQSSLAPSQIGEIHNGADDNASGTAGVMELARLAANDNRDWARSAMFMAFTAEEIGLLGSAHFADNPSVPIENINAMINMDMIGRISNDKLYVGGVGTSPDYPEILEAANESGLMLETSESGYGASDHTSFNIKRIPVLFFFSGLHTDYHKPSDDADKINAEDAVGALSIVYNVMDRLADEPLRLAYSEVERPEAPGRGGGGGYGPWFGSVPDFRDGAGGVPFADVVTDSPAAKAGLMGGDILTEFDGIPITNLNEYAYALRGKQPGDVVDVVVMRDGMEMRVSVTLEARR